MEHEREMGDERPGARVLNLNQFSLAISGWIQQQVIHAEF
jgi:hypothetical protein